MANEICDCCTTTFDMDRVGIVKKGKKFCSVECLRSYAIDYELNKIAEVLGVIADQLDILVAKKKGLMK